MASNRGSLLSDFNAAAAWAGITAFVWYAFGGKLPDRCAEWVLHDVTWADYLRHLRLRGEGSVPRLSYLEGMLELMTPSRSHEGLAYLIGRLVEVWCLERGVEFTAVGETTRMMPCTTWRIDAMNSVGHLIGRLLMSAVITVSSPRS